MRYKGSKIILPFSDNVGTLLLGLVLTILTKCGATLQLKDLFDGLLDENEGRAVRNEPTVLLFGDLENSGVASLLENNASSSSCGRWDEERLSYCLIPSSGLYSFTHVDKERSEVSSAYAANIVLRSAKFVKVVLMVNYKHLKKDAGTEAFLRECQNLLHFLGGSTKFSIFKDSVGLLLIMQDARSFVLEDAQSFLRNALNNIGYVYKGVEDLISTFLENKRIVSITSVGLAETGSIFELLRSLALVDLSISNYTFPYGTMPSLSTQGAMRSLYETSLRQLRASLSSAIAYWISEEERKFDDHGNPIEYFQNNWESDKRILTNAIRNSTNASILFPRNISKPLERHRQVSTFIQTVLWEDGDGVLDNLTKESLVAVEEFGEWLSFLSLLQEHLSTYTFQKRKALFNISDIENNWGKGQGENNSGSGISITLANYKTFLEKASLEFSLQSVTSRQLSERQVERLDSLVAESIRTNTEVVCSREDGSVVVKGPYVVFDINIVLQCTPAPQHVKTFWFLFFPVKQAHFMATKKLFIPENMRMAETRATSSRIRRSPSADGEWRIVGWEGISIISPVVEIVGTATIQLEGSKGSVQPKPSPQTNTNGLPAPSSNPGGQGGYIFVAMGKGIHMDKLTLSSVGGDGADGTIGGETISTTKQSYMGGQGAEGGLGGYPGLITVVDKADCKIVFRNRTYAFLPPIQIVCPWVIKQTQGGSGKPGGFGKFAYMSPSLERQAREEARRIRGGVPRAAPMPGYSSPLSMQIKAKPPITSQGSASPSSLVARYIKDSLPTLTRWNRRRILAFFETLETAPDVKKYSNTETFAEGVRDLFHNILLSNNESEVVHLGRCESLKKTLSKYITSHASYAKSSDPHCGPNRACYFQVNYDGNDFSSAEHKLLLLTTYTSVLGCRSLLKKRAEATLIINISAFLDVLSKAIEDYNSKADGAEKEKQEVRIRENMVSINKDYKGSIDAKAAEGQKLVESQILPDIEEAKSTMSHKIDELLDTIKLLSQRGVAEKKELEDKRRKLIAAMKAHTIFDVLGFVAKGVSLLGPIGAAVGTVASIALPIIEGAVVSDDGKGAALSPPPPGIADSSTAMLNLFKGKYDAENNAVMEQINEIESALSQEPEKFKTPLDKLLKGKEELDSLIKKLPFSPKAVIDKRQEIANGISKFLNTFDKKAAAKVDVKIKGILERVENAKGLITIVEGGLDLLDKFKERKDEIGQVEGMIAESNRRIAGLKKTELVIHASVSPMISDFQVGIDAWSHGRLQNRSLLQLDLSKYQIGKAIRSVRDTMTDFGTTIHLEVGFTRVLTNLIETMNTLVGMYDRVATYQEQKQWADYIFALSNAKTVPTTNPAIRALQSDISLMSKWSQVRWLYKKGIEAFHQAVFPFAHSYLEKWEVPSGGLLHANDTSAVAERAGELISDLKSQLALEQTMINTQRDANMQFETFRESESSVPFHTWKWEDHSSEIKSLLSGKEVSLLAPMSSNKSTYNALKFTTVSLDIRSRGQGTELYASLSFYKLSMTHTGNNYYRCKDKTYLITSPAVDIEYSLEKGDGFPKSYNLNYKKLRNGDFTLSPYTLWTLRLLTYMPKARDFSRLDAYADTPVDLHLGGFGLYLGERVECSTLDLDKYYSEVNYG